MTAETKTIADGWPDRPAFARFRVTTVEKPDGRRVHYYDWPDVAESGDTDDADTSSADAPSPATEEGGV